VKYEILMFHITVIFIWLLEDCWKLNNQKVYNKAVWPHNSSTFLDAYAQFRGLRLGLKPTVRVR